MYRVRRLLRLAALATGVAVALALASSAEAATVTRELLSPGEPEPFYAAACSFPLIVSFSGTIEMTVIEKTESVQLMFTPVGPQTITVTNPANGKSITGMGQTAGEILKFSESSFVDHLNGITLNFVLPGVGGVLQVIGNVNFADLTFSGRDTRGDTTAFCNYLADP